MLRAAAVEAQDLQYIALIDAGSSGSRIHVHAFQPAPSGLPTIFPSTNLKSKPGLSSFASKPEEAGEGAVTQRFV
jgi:hypothetical protein